MTPRRRREQSEHIVPPSGMTRFTTLYGYDLAHRRTTTVEPLPAAGATARVTTTTYYPDGSAKSATSLLPRSTL